MKAVIAFLLFIRIISFLLEWIPNRVGNNRTKKMKLSQKIFKFKHIQVGCLLPTFARISFAVTKTLSFPQKRESSGVEKDMDSQSS